MSFRTEAGHAAAETHAWSSGSSSSGGPLRLKREASNMSYQKGKIHLSARGGGGAAPGDAFAHATSGAGGSVPYRGEMEKAFGRSFGDVTAHTGGQAATEGLGALGARGAAQGSTVAFNTASPSKELVAHELTHVVQGSGGVHQSSDVSKPSDAAEVEADKVASSVASGHAAGPISGQAGGIHLDPDPNATAQTAGTAGTAAGAAPAAATTSHFRIELKAWIPHPRVVDPEQMPSDIIDGIVRAMPMPVRGESEAHFRGDNHTGYAGSYRVMSVVEFDWDGSHITGLAQSGSYGASHRDWTVRLLALGYEVSRRTGTDTATATSATSGGAAGTAGFSMGMSSANPLVRIWAPTIDSELTGTLSGSTMSLSYTTDLFPSHGIKVTKNGRQLYNSIVNDASGVNALGAIGAVNVGNRLTSHSNSGSASFPL